MKKEAAIAAIFLPSLLSLLLLFVFAASVSVQAQLPAAKPAVEVVCHDNGAFSISNLDKPALSVSIKKSGGTSYKASGSWRDTSDGLSRFTSDDMAIVDVSGGYYTVTADKASYGVTCPPFKFSCKLINISINSCYKREDNFTAKFTAYSFRYDKKNEFRFEKPFVLTYKAFAEVNGRRKELMHAPSILSPEFKTINMTRIRRVGSNTYTLKWQTPLDISKFVVQYDECQTQKYKFYDSLDCTPTPSCGSDADCLQSEHCDDGFCNPISCGSCQYIGDHACVDYACCTDEDCDKGFTCSDRKCQPLSCQFDEYIVGHGCDKLACADDEYLSNHSCSRLNCQKSQAAVNHVCKDIACSDDESLDLETNSCKKLSCGFLKKVSSHQCVSVFSSLFKRNKASTAK